MADVFISFIHEQREVATAVQQFLREHLQRDVFISANPWQVFAGEDWLQKIRTQLQAARVVILMLSPESIGRPWINFEAGAAWLANKVVIPVCFGGLTVEGLPKPYSNLQALTLPEGAYYLFASVMHHLDPMRPVPPPFPPRGEEIRRIREVLEPRNGAEQVAGAGR